jgi:hypothetical protein
MRQKDRSRSKRDDLRLEVLVDRIDRTLASLGKAEIELRDLNRSRLPQTVESLAKAAADVESLREKVSISSPGSRIPAVLRTQIKRMEQSAGRVSALHQAARRFHAGLMLVRKRELAEYDALGGVSEVTEALVPSHSLEARG